MTSQEGYLVGLDAGGGGGRALVLSLADGAVTSAYRSWQHKPAPGTSGLGFDLDTEAVFESLAEACREALGRAGAEADQVIGVSATSMREGMVLLSGDEIVLATPNRDARALSEGFGLAESHGERIYQISGRWPLPVFPAARLLWLKSHASEALARADSLLSISDWLLWRLSGERCSEPSQACESMLFDTAACQWDEELIDELGLPSRLFPNIAIVGTPLGTLRAEAAEIFGLRAGTVVTLGGADSQSGLLGCGVVQAGQAGAITGTTSPVQIVADRPLLDPKRRTWTGNHVLPGMWTIESNAGLAGETLEWFARTLRPDHSRPVAWLLAEASRSRPGAAGLMSTLGAEIMNSREPRMPLGHLSLSHMTTADDGDRRAHLTRSVVEGMAFALRANFEQAAEVAGTDPDCLHMAGGMTRSAFWRQLVSDVFGCRVEASATAEASPLGAAIAAAVGSGLFDDLVSASEALVPAAVVHDPDPEAQEVLEETYGGWKRLRASERAADEEAATIIGAELFKEEDSQEGTTAVQRPRILVTAGLDENSLAELGRWGKVEYENFRDTMKVLTGEELIKRLEGVEVFITETEVIGVDALARLPALRVIGSCRSDAVNVDIDACSAFGVLVLNAPGRNAHAVADMTLGFALMLVRKAKQADQFMREPGARAGDMARMGRAFKLLTGNELGGLCFGLAGFGAVGREVAHRLRAFGARVIVYDPYISNGLADLADVEVVSFEELLDQADVLSLHMPVTEETRGVIGKRELSRMRAGSFLINTARAALVDEEALLESLESGHLGGAALDVFAVEPPGSNHPLLSRDDVIATPHIAGNTAEVAGHQGRIIAADIGRLLGGRPVLNSLNPEIVAAFSWGGPRPQPSEEAIAGLRTKPGPALTDLQRDGRTERGDTNRVSWVGGSSVNGKLRENMERLLKDFTRRIDGDGKLTEAAQKTAVVMHFELHDLDLDFHFALADGSVRSSMGVPESVDVELAMRAEILDGMMTGAINGMEAASEGELSFTGDVTKAMSLQELSGDLERLYCEARSAVGDPGDLSSTRDSGALSTVAGTDGRANELIGVVKELYGTGLITATGGNVSARREAGSDELLITPSAMFKGELSAELLVRIDLEGRPLDKASRSPSSERLMHTAIYQAKPDTEAVIHCHAPNATILANTELPFLPISTEAAFFSDIPRVPFIMPGTAELAEAVAAAIGTGWAVLMKNHGLIVGGRSLRRAADMAEIIERSAEIMLGCWAVGKEPPVLPEDVVAKLRVTGELIA